MVFQKHVSSRVGHRFAGILQERCQPTQPTFELEEVFTLEKGDEYLTKDLTMEKVLANKMTLILSRSSFTNQMGNFMPVIL